MRREGWEEEGERERDTEKGEVGHSLFNNSSNCSDLTNPSPTQSDSLIIRKDTLSEDAVLLLPQVGDPAALLEEVTVVLILLLVDGRAGDQGGRGRGSRGPSSVPLETSDKP